MLADHILFLDGEAIVVDKPAGLPVDPPRDGSISVENHLASLTFGFRRWPTPVHRLDRDTSGCLLLARNPGAAKRFAAAFEARGVAKRYLAVLDGVVAGDEGVIDLPLVKTSTAADGWRMRGAPIGEKPTGSRSDAGKPARTAWRVLARHAGRSGADRTLVEFAPETGRTHQLRVHALEGLGAAIVGDTVYGRPDPECPREAMLLHAAGLVLPRDGKPPVSAAAPLPARFAAAGFAAELVDAVGGNV